MSDELVLVTGGTGFIGVNCIIRLLADGARVRSTVRDLRRADDLRGLVRLGGADPAGIEVVAADLMDDAGWPDAVRGAVFESSEAKRWLLGGYYHGHCGNLSHTIATEMAFAFRFTAERLYELGWLNRLTDAEGLLPAAREMANHLLTLPPASRVNTLTMMRAMRARVPAELEDLAAKLKEHGAKDDLMESRKAFAEKRPPRFKGWNDPADRKRTPKLAHK